jgi:hypothetical protein
VSKDLEEAFKTGKVTGVGEGAFSGAFGGDFSGEDILFYFLPS